MNRRLSTPAGTWIEGEMVVHSSFISLKGAAPQVLLLFRCKCVMEKRPKRKPKRWRPRILNNGEITFYYSEAEKRGITRPRFKRAIDELVKKGFIDIMRPGNGFARIPTLYAISDRWRKWGTPEFEHATRAKDTRNRRRRAEEVGNASIPCIGNANVPCSCASSIP